MDELNRWFDAQATSPVGSLVLFVLIYLLRITIDREVKRRRRRPPKKPAGHTSSGA